MKKKFDKPANPAVDPVTHENGFADDAADFLDKPRSYRLTAEQRAEVRLALKELDEGRFASQQELDALWRRAGLTV